MTDCKIDSDLCGDCGIDTTPQGERCEYYMVKNSIWKEAQKQGKVDFLCIGCLENRLGRQLVSDDFADVMLNYWKFKQTDRLIDRLGEKFADEENYLKTELHSL